MTERRDRLVPPVTARSAHLSDEELTAVEVSRPAEKHVADCAWCRQRRDRVSDDERAGLEHLLAELDAVPVAEPTLEAASSWAMPTALSEVLDADSAQWPGVEAAQLWRLSWHGHDALAVVLEKSSWWVTVAPLSTDVDLADEYALLCDAKATTLSHPTAVFLRAAATVPQYTLATFLGKVSPSGVLDPADELRRLNVACMRGTTPPADLPTGRRLEPDDWDRQEALDALVELMGTFEAANNDVVDPSGSILGSEPDQLSADSVGTPASANVIELLAKSNLQELTDATGLEPSRLLDMLQGSGKPTPEEREVLRRHFGTDVSGGYPEVARLALLEVVSEPGNRSLWMSRSRSAHHYSDPRVQPESVRPFLEHELTHGLAARTNYDPDRGEPDGGIDAWRNLWRERLSMRRR